MLAVVVTLRVISKSRRALIKSRPIWGTKSVVFFGQHRHDALVPELSLKNKIAASIADFLLEIGLEVETAVIEEKTTLPGIHIDGGKLIIDESKLLHPGDLLHEAGHLAVTPANRRKELHGDVGQGGGEEMAAIAWSYAAAIHLGLDPAVVFHAEGYQGGAQSILENFAQGRTVGVPLLQWMGLTFEEKIARQNGQRPFPAMANWLRGPE
jgi:hypothetical protein